MKRRDLLTSVFVAGLSVPVIGGVLQKGSHDQDEDQGAHGHHDNDGRPHRNVAINFGHWGPTAAAPFDRFGAGANDRTRNVHELTPNPAKVHVGDSISFIISGLHNPQVYAPGTLPEDIDRTTATGAPAIINDPNRRVYRGLDPRVLNLANPPVQDRVEAISLTEPGRYLVICGVLVHFFDAVANKFVMFGFIDVEPAED